MFWIHGGGNTSGLKDLYDFNKMVRRHNVIVVRINYRLGPFGWFTHPSIQDFQTNLDKTSNFGTLDIIAALHWVKENIPFWWRSRQCNNLWRVCWRTQCLFFTCVRQIQGTFSQSNFNVRLYNIN